MTRRHEGSDGSDVTRSPLRRWGPPALLLLAAILFVAQNTEHVSFDFFTMSFTFQLWVMLLVFAAAGAFVGWWVRRER